MGPWWSSRARLSRRYRGATTRAGSPLERHELERGTTATTRRGHVHDVTNEATKVEVHLHVYQPQLTTMTHYDLTDDQLGSPQK